MCICGCCPRRYVTITLACLGMLLVHAMRVNLAFAVITHAHNNSTQNVTIDVGMASKAAWSSPRIGFLHSVFYIGYFISQLPSGYITTKLASHRLFGGCIIISSALNLLLPVAIVEGGYVITCSVRALQGISEGMLFPSCYAILHQWVIPTERSRMGAIVLSGVYLGPVIGLICSGFVTFFLGWHYIFYLHGGFGVLWFSFWLACAHESPALDPTMKVDERKLIRDSQGSSVLNYENAAVPWRAIFTSIPLHALNVCNFARSFVFFLLLTNGPTFLAIFNFTVTENGILSSTPHAAMSFVALLSGPLADYLIGRSAYSVTRVRKLLTSLGFGLESICLCVVGLTFDFRIAVAFLAIGVGISGITVSGWQINHLDLSPRYASVLISITNSVGTVAGIVSPIVVGEITRNRTIENWHKVFLMSSAVVCFAAFFYAIFGSGEIQSWSEPTERVVLAPETSQSRPEQYGTFWPQGGDVRYDATIDTTQHKTSCDRQTHL